MIPTIVRDAFEYLKILNENLNEPEAMYDLMDWYNNSDISDARLMAIACFFEKGYNMDANLDAYYDLIEQLFPYAEDAPIELHPQTTYGYKDED